jgi:tRNA-Thr(GGU) m(6)t(6)A37 methyltransferase TsaA
MNAYAFKPIGFVRSALKDRSAAPKQGFEGAPEAWLEIENEYAQGLDGLSVGDQVVLVTWFHESRRDVLKLHPRGDPKLPITGVFATRSPDRPNPLGLHRVTLHEITGTRLRVGPLEAIDGTPVVDLKPVLAESADS